MTVRRDELSAGFFDAASRSELVVRRCTACGTLATPRARACPACATPALDWVPVSGTGTLVSWTALRDRAGEITALGGIVELTEGPWLRVRLAAEPAALAVGLPMRVRFEQQDAGEPVPVFRPWDEGDADGRR